MKNTLPTYARYKRDYETAKSVGAAALACNAVLIPTGFEHMRLLFQNFTRPMVTNNDPADVDYAGGLAAHVQGVPKTDFETSVTAIETEKKKKEFQYIGEGVIFMLIILVCCIFFRFFKSYKRHLIF